MSSNYQGQPKGSYTLNSRPLLSSDRRPQSRLPELSIDRKCMCGGERPEVPDRLPTDFQ